MVTNVNAYVSLFVYKVKQGNLKDKVVTGNEIEFYPD